MEKKRILIINDLELFAKVTKCFLEGSGDYDVEYETDSTQAIERVRSEKPDLILLDIVMPNLDGGLVQALLCQDPILNSIPILFITSMVSQSDSDSVDGCLVQSGGNSMLPKTTSPDLIRKCIGEKLAGRI